MGEREIHWPRLSRERTINHLPDLGLCVAPLKVLSHYSARWLYRGLCAGMLWVFIQ
jgi:hypothetical protein